MGARTLVLLRNNIKLIIDQLKIFFKPVNKNNF